MLSRNALHNFLDESARRRPNHVAVEDPASGGVATYHSLGSLSDRLRDRLVALGVGQGDRVGIYMRKSIDAVAAIFGIMKAGGAYVPVDPGAPVARGAYILDNCSVKVVIVERPYADLLRAELEKLGEPPRLLVVDLDDGGLAAALEGEQARAAAAVAETVASDLDDLAYILYTSGSTGKPKGVMLSHRNAISYVDWCSETCGPTEEDRFSSHAPFHFDLSILDLFVPIKHGATVVLIGTDAGKDPATLAPLIAERRISIWYSTPSILSLLAQYGKLERYNYSALRIVLFAGEVFPVKHLRALKALLPHPRYFNLYGPTETNVCTFYEIPATIPPDRTEPFPIGKACSHLRTKVFDEGGREVDPGEEGELCVSGAGVMQGYWNLPERTGRAFFVDEAGERWYKTGDVVIEAPGRDYIFLGRRDRMVKRRGYRVELGEIEAGLYRHPAVEEVGVIAAPDEENGVKIKAFLSCHDGRRPSVIELKQFCARHLPLYMVPDAFTFLEALPHTSTDKIDYQGLKERA